MLTEALLIIYSMYNLLHSFPRQVFEYPVKIDSFEILHMVRYTLF